MVSRGRNPSRNRRINALRNPLAPGRDCAAGRKTLFATRTPVIAGCAPQRRASRIADALSSARVPCTHLALLGDVAGRHVGLLCLLWRRLKRPTTLGGWGPYYFPSLPSLRLSCSTCTSFLFISLTTWLCDLMDIIDFSPHASVTKKSTVITVQQNNFPSVARSTLERAGLRVDGELPAGCASLRMPPRVQAHVLAPARQGGTPRDRSSQGRRPRVVARAVDDGTPAQTARLLGRRRRTREPKGQIQEARRLHCALVYPLVLCPNPELDPGTFHPGGG